MINNFVCMNRSTSQKWFHWGERGPASSRFSLSTSQKYSLGEKQAVTPARFQHVECCNVIPHPTHTHPSPPPSLCLRGRVLRLNLSQKNRCRALQMMLKGQEESGKKSSEAPGMLFFYSLTYYFFHLSQAILALMSLMMVYSCLITVPAWLISLE